MTLAVLNINDVGVQVAVKDDLIRTSPGYALLDEHQLLTGEEASQKVRLLPRWTNNRFWSQLNTQPLPNRTGQVRHHADLAFAHLEALWLPIKQEVNQVIFCVPGYYSAENLGLLLGMAKECGLPVTGVVDQSLVAASNLPLAPTVLHLDIQLHHITLTRLSNQDLLVRKSTKTVTEIGLATLWERWANIIASQFIQATRFDPMHDASSEQQMFDQLPDWIGKLDPRGMNRFELNLETGKQSINVSRDTLLTACTPLYPQIVQMIRQEISDGTPASLLVSHHFAGFPGLHDSLSLIKNLELVYLSESKSVDSARERQDEITRTQGEMSHILQLSVGTIVTEDATEKGIQNSTPKTDRQAPSHLLWQHQATPIGRSFKLGRDFSSGARPELNNPACTLYLRNNELLMECHDREAVRINGEKPDHLMSLHLGDELTDASRTQTLILIRVPADG